MSSNQGGLDAGALIDSFKTGDYVVTQRAKGSHLKGRAVAGATSTLTISASVQPANGRDLQRLPEERRSVETRVIYTRTELRVGAQDAAFESDLVAIDGKNWEVQNVQDWPAAVGYFRVLAQMVG